MPDLTAAGADGLPVLTLADRAALDAWLDAHGGTARGAWLRLADDDGHGAPSRADAVEALLCAGWATGQRAPDADGWHRQRVAPRRLSERWSQAEVAAVQRLQAQGRMRPGGLQAVAQARADGRWERAYAPPSTGEVPDDLRAALDAEPAAAAAFAGLSPTNRHAVLHRVTTAKRVAARERRVVEFVQMLAEGRTPYPQAPAAQE